MGGPTAERDGPDATLADRVRRAVILRQLDDHLPAPPARIVDVGAGSGWLAARLARRGFEVVALDASPARLRLARERLADQPPQVAARVRVVRGRALRARDVLGAGGFAVVCCHAVLPFVDDPAGLWATLAGLAEDGAVVSVIAKNGDALAMRAGLEGRFAAAAELLGGGREHAADGTPLAAHSVDELTAAARRVGLTVRRWYGVQTFTAHRSEPAGAEQVAAAVDLELRAGRRDPYRRVARQVHVVGTRA